MNSMEPEIIDADFVVFTDDLYEREYVDTTNKIIVNYNCRMVTMGLRVQGERFTQVAETDIWI